MLTLVGIFMVVVVALLSNKEQRKGAWLLAAVVVLLPSLAATLPLGFYWDRPAVAATAICAANLVSLGVFRLLTIAGLVAQVIVLYRLGRRGPCRGLQRWRHPSRSCSD